MPRSFATGVAIAETAPTPDSAISPADAAEVVSSNTVGYNKVTLQKGYNLLGSNWNLVGGGNGTLTDILNAEDLPGFNGESFDSQLLLWSGNGYSYYGWAGNVGEATYDYKWLNKSTLDPTAIPAAKGSAFWIESGDDDVVVTFSGEVATNDTVTIPISQGYNLVANPFPKSISIQQIQSEDLPGFDGENFNAQILIWTGTGYTYYGWAGYVGDATYDYKWLNKSTLEPANVTLDIGKGLWIETKTAANVVFSK